LRLGRAKIVIGGGVFQAGNVAVCRRSASEVPLFVNLAGDEMALLIEMVVDLGMN
jgi:hypothetical protein